MNNIIKKELGQSVVEVIFLIGALALVLTGAVVLLVNSLNSRTQGFDRKKATEMAEYVIEGLVDSKMNDPMTFWVLSPQTDQKIEPQFDGYTYSVGYSDVTGKYSCTNACFEATVQVNWMRDTAKSVSFTRLFYRQ